MEPLRKKVKPSTVNVEKLLEIIIVLCDKEMQGKTKA